MKMDRMAAIVALILVFFCTKSLNSQIIIGVQNNYSGSRSLSLNPALMSTSYLYFDVSIANVGMMFINDYAYMRADDLKKVFFSSNHALPEYDVLGKESPYLIYDLKESKSRNLYESLDINLINIMYNFNGKHSIAFSLNSRIYSSIDNLSWEVPLLLHFGVKKLMNENLISEYENFESKDIWMTTLEWNEVAFSFASTCAESKLSRIDLGVSLKYLMGYSAAAMNIDKIDYSAYNDDSVYVDYLKGDFVYSLPIEYDQDFSNGMEIFDKTLQRGSGIAIDLGFTYTKKKYIDKQVKYLSSCFRPKIYYHWKFGVSIADLGFINFNKNAVNGHYYKDSNEERVLFDKTEFDKFTKFEDISKYLSAVFNNGDSTAYLVDNKFRMGLPTTLRVHFDYNIKSNFYVSAVVVQPLKLFKYSVMASPQIVLEPRYESTYFDFSLPLSLRNNAFLSVGALARIGFITVGTYNIANYLGIGNVNGLDFYFSIKINIEKDVCNNKKDACWSDKFGNKYFK